MVPGRWDIDVETDAPAQLVVSEGYDPGWRGRIDGKDVKVFRTNDQFLSVAVPAGRHRLRLEYEPKEFRQGAIVSLVGVLLCAAGPLGMWCVRKRIGRAGGDARARDRAEGAASSPASRQGESGWI